MSMLVLLRRVLAGLVTAVLLAPASVMAQDPDDLDVTMRMVVDDEDLADNVVQELQLPEPAASGRKGSGASGRERAEDAREQGRALGQRISGEARGQREDRSLDRPEGDQDLIPGNPGDDIDDGLLEPDIDPRAEPPSNPGNRP